MITPFGSSEECAAIHMAVQSDGRIVGAGFPGGSFALARYSRDGSLDTTSTRTAGRPPTMEASTERGTLAIQTDRKDVKIVAAGRTGVLGEPTTSDMA